MSALSHIVKRLRLRRFVSDSRGNVALLYGLALIPLTIAAGAAFDYAMAATQRAKLQHANDDAVIAVARAVQGNSALSAAQQQAIIENYLQAEVPSSTRRSPTIRSTPTARSSSTPRRRWRAH